MTDVASQIDTAVQRGLGFLLARQALDGAWSDWALPPGPSPDWTTAYVGNRLASLNARDLQTPLAHAARWLLARRKLGGGWGYSAEVDEDADTTAHALLFLDAMGSQAPIETYAALGRYQRDDGGFSTFLPDGLMGAWGISHPEITPIALMALRTRPGTISAADEARAVQAILHARRPDGLWNAYWWDSPLPACEANLACLSAKGHPEALPAPLRHLVPKDALEAALLLSLSVRHATPARLADLSSALTEAQSRDGSWPSTPSLRIPPRSCARPWEAPRIYKLYADTGRLFTTATVVAALGAAHRRLASDVASRGTAQNQIAAHDLI